MLSLILGAAAETWRDPIFGQSAGQFFFSVICIVVVLAIVFWILRRLGIL